MKALRLSSLSYLCFILLSLSDVELNLGHVAVPCENCALEVSDQDPAVEYDKCGHWFHIQCQSIDQDTYGDWVAADHSFSWTCSNYDHPFQNFSNVTSSSFMSYESPNNFSVLIDESPSPHRSRGPSPTARATQPRENSSTKTTKLRVLNASFSRS